MPKPCVDSLHPDHGQPGGCPPAFATRSSVEQAHDRDILLRLVEAEVDSLRAFVAAEQERKARHDRCLAAGHAPPLVKVMRMVRRVLRRSQRGCTAASEHEVAPHDGGAAGGR